MPHTPDPIEDGLDSLPPPVFHVEQALLGALLLEPHCGAGLTGITAGAFSSAAHAALFAAIRSLPAPEPAEHAKTTTWLNRVLTAAEEQTRGLTTTYLHHLIQCCPEPHHAPAYARIIEEEYSRRLLRAAAHRLIQTTLDTSLPHRVATTLAEAGTLTTVVNDIATRFPTRSGSLPRTPASTPVTTRDEAAGEEEQLLLATATARPGSVDGMRWLVPGDFTHPLHAGLWQCLTTLTRRGTPIDPVTVLWEAQHHGIAGAAEPRELLGLLSEPDGCDPEHWGEQILQRSLLTTAHHTGRRIETLTDDPATTTYQLVVGARRALADLSAVRARWHHATTPPQVNTPTRTKATAPPRAGPPPTTAPPSVRIPR
ncbi:DnaB-like helicase N-terminal domain-containing protein [Streptomyces sp. NPDC059943]|uniref:DnaB-like helicase N-terminal domain-containing protein n=1 Tax=Streptomyces sp. NPDC059943 TaxID=3347010 RepID=UPI0036663159